MKEIEWKYRTREEIKWTIEYNEKEKEGIKHECGEWNGMKTKEKGECDEKKIERK